MATLVGIDPGYSEDKGTVIAVYDGMTCADTPKIHTVSHGKGHDLTRLRDYRNDTANVLNREVQDSLVVCMEKPHAIGRGKSGIVKALYYFLSDAISPRQGETTFYEVTSGTLKKFVTSKGNCSKDDMLQFVPHHWGETFVPEDYRPPEGTLTNDEADAVGLLALAAFLNNHGEDDDWTQYQHDAVCELTPWEAEEDGTS